MEMKELEARVEKAEEKVVKCQKTIERHEKSLDKKKKEGDSYGVHWKENDIKGATRKLEDAKRILDNWKSKLHVEIEKERFLEGHAPQVIKDFLEEWKKKSFDWHVKRCQDYLSFCKKLEKEKTEAQIEYIKQAPEYADQLDELGNLACELHWITSTPNRKMEAFLHERELTYRQIQKRKIEFAGMTVLSMSDIRDEKKRLEWLDKELEAEKKAKMLDLIYRINKVVGSITDAKRLRISVKGNLDGYVSGTDGEAKIETIGAGGHNIQCFHFRTLVHAV